MNTLHMLYALVYQPTAHGLLTLATALLVVVSADAAPRRLACLSEAGETSARYWSEQAKNNRNFGNFDKANQFEQNAAYCEASEYGRKVVVTFDTGSSATDIQSADFQLYTICGFEGGHIIPAKIYQDNETYTVSYYHNYYRMMRYFHIDRDSLAAGFVDQRDFQCRFESYDLSDKLL